MTCAWIPCASDPFIERASRDWMVETDADWVVVSPESGLASADAQTVTVTVLENTGLDRSVDVKFTIGMKSKYLTVNQAGPKGSAENLIVYYNDYDKEVAEKTYGSGSSWPYLDQFDGFPTPAISTSKTAFTFTAPPAKR